MEAFIFDMDGVIIDSEPLHERVKRETFSQFGLPLPAEGLSHFVGRTSRELFTEVLARAGRMDVTAEDIARFKHERYLSLLQREGVPCIPGSLALIRALHAEGVPLALATSSWRRVVDQVLDSLSLHEVFSSVISGADLPRSKPDPAIYLLSAQRLGVKPADCTVLEDSESGVEAAKRAGMRCIGFISPHSGAQDLCRADGIVHRLEEIDPTPGHWLS